LGLSPRESIACRIAVRLFDELGDAIFYLIDQFIEFNEAIGVFDRGELFAVDRAAVALNVISAQRLNSVFMS